MVMHWEYATIVLACCEWVYEWAQECKHNSNGVYIFFGSDSTLTVMCFWGVVSKEIAEISNVSYGNALGLYRDRFGVL